MFCRTILETVTRMSLPYTSLRHYLVLCFHHPGMSLSIKHFVWFVNTSEQVHKERGWLVTSFLATIQISYFRAAAACTLWTARISYFFLPSMQNISIWLIFFFFIFIFNWIWTHEGDCFSDTHNDILLSEVCSACTQLPGLGLGGNFPLRPDWQEILRLCWLVSITRLLSFPQSSGKSVYLLFWHHRDVWCWWFPQHLLSSFCHTLVAFVHLLQLLHWS